MTFKKYALTFLCTTTPLFGNSLEKVFDAFGADSNFTGPTSYQDQAAGNYSGGGLYMNTKNKSAQLIQVSPPHYSMGGCGNIKMGFGAISLINSKELQELAKSIVDAGKAYAIQLALKTISPQIENTVNQLRDLSLAMSSTMLNSCQASQQIVGSLWPKNKEASEQICKDMKASDNEDSYAARKHCSNPDVVDESIERAKSKHKDLLAGNYNLVWHALKKMDIYKNDHQLAEFVMTLVGTIISRKEEKNGPYRIQRIHGKSDSLKYLTVYLKGGATEKLKCDKHDECLNPTIQQKNVSKGLASILSEKINSMEIAYKSGLAFKPDEKSFLNDASNLDVYKYIQIHAASTSFKIDGDMVEYISIKMILIQFDRILVEMMDAVDFLSKVQMEDSQIIQFREDLKSARLNIQSLFNATHSSAADKFYTRMRNAEKTIYMRNM